MNNGLIISIKAEFGLTRAQHRACSHPDYLWQYRPWQVRDPRDVYHGVDDVPKHIQQLWEESAGVWDEAQ